MKRQNRQFEQAKTLFLNGSGEAVPAFGVIRVIETVPTTRQALNAQRPNGVNSSCTFWVNLPHKVTVGKTGFCTREAGCYALFDATNTPVPGEIWGPDNDWKLHKGKDGFKIVGGIQGSGATARVRVSASAVGEPGEPGPAGGGSELARFMLTEDFDRGEVYATANLVDLTNEPIGGDAPDWTAATAVATGERRRATADVGGFSTGQIVTSNSNRTTGATFDATEAAEWSAAVGDDYQIVVVDQEGKFYGYAGYTDPQFGQQTGYIGECRYTGESDYAGTGLAGWQIVHIEAPARWIEGVVAKDPEASEEVVTYPAWPASTHIPPFYKVICPTSAGGLAAGDVIISIFQGSRVSLSTFTSTEASFWKKFADAPEPDVRDYFYLSVDRYWGAAPNNRPPKTELQDSGTYEEEVYYTVKVYCRLGEPLPEEGDKVRALLDDEALPMQYVLAKGGSDSAVIAYGALAIVKGTVPKSSGIDTSGDLVVNSNTGKSVFTPGKLEVEPPNPATTFDSGAMMVYPTGEAIVVNGSLQIFNVMNPSRSEYSGNGESIVEGSLVTDAEGVEWFCISWDDDSRSEGHLKGATPAGGSTDDPDLQIKYHSGGDDNYKVASAPCGGA